MTFQIIQREREGIVILDLDGELVLGEQNSDLRRCFARLIESGVFNVALNLDKVSRIDSTGLGTLVFALVKMSKAGGRLALFNVNATHLNLLLLTKLITVFELFASELDAANSFFPGRATQRYDILSFVDEQDDAPPVESFSAFARPVPIPYPVL